MLQNLKQRKQEGFTIIEVMIVLAIAGLIMLVVFLAVPALQRNSHNNSYRTQANNIASAVSEVTANKQGSGLSASSYTNGTTAATSDAQSVLKAANTSDISKLTIVAGAGNFTAANVSDAVIETNANCPSSVPGTAGAAVVPVTGTTTRSTIVLFGIEVNGGFAGQCRQVQ